MSQLTFWKTSLKVNSITSIMLSTVLMECGLWLMLSIGQFKVNEEFHSYSKLWSAYTLL